MATATTTATDLLSKEGNDDDDDSLIVADDDADADVVDFRNMSVLDALRTSVSLYETHDVAEPVESTVHVLSHVLDLPWENGFVQLRSILLPEQRHNDDGGGGGVDNVDSAAALTSSRILTDDEASRYGTLVRRRLFTSEPIQYLVGQWDFHDVTLIVKKPMLCPRPETEELVEIVAEEVRRRRRRILKKKNGNKGGETTNSDTTKVRVLDVGCGTGAIGLALMELFRGSGEEVEVAAIDVERSAVDLSNENADLILLGGVKKAGGGRGIDGDEEEAAEAGAAAVRRRYRAVHCSADQFTHRGEGGGEGRRGGTGDNGHTPYEFDFDIVVSNPPYIPSSDMGTLSDDVIRHESPTALCGGTDGLDVVRDIVRRLPEWSTSSSVDDECVCWMEVDESHPTLIEEWLKPGSDASVECGVEFVERRQDLSGRDRFVKLRVVAR